MTAPRYSSFEYQRLLERRRALGIGENGKKMTPKEKKQSREEVAEAVIQ